MLVLIYAEKILNVNLEIEPFTNCSQDRDWRWQKTDRFSSEKLTKVLNSGDWIKVFCTLISKQKKQIIINMKKRII